MTWITPDRLFDGERLHEGLALRLDAGRVIDLAPRDPRMDAKVVPGLVTPGYVDLQVNGGGGVLLNTEPTVAGMEAIASAHRRLGTVAILPTLITDAPEVMDRAVDAALAARGRPGIIGIHLEGPHISVVRRGTHAARFIRPLDERTLAAVRRLREGGVPVLLTLAPEATSPGQIAELDRMGVVVSLGHSDATAEQARAALAEGARTFTRPLQCHVAADPSRPGPGRGGAELRGSRGPHLRRHPCRGRRAGAGPSRTPGAGPVLCGVRRHAHRRRPGSFSPLRHGPEGRGRPARQPRGQPRRRACHDGRECRPPRDPGGPLTRGRASDGRDRAVWPPRPPRPRNGRRPRCCRPPGARRWAGCGRHRGGLGLSDVSPTSVPSRRPDFARSTASVMT
ncbi:N-acetylglucosamine-6-phosphate deacetylase [Rubellimicrobium mesophilum DSM 19309]|uniref:N-acetylglucosamine-6-phosphate deacetylase n=1 Tax=Rubellimicrobium mesophilum DSM 19309 TaxID=442562 RepID=A0A017HW51_9RHOB|nr:N-acetylglucosamine-6-phosphate deacetylase [Rubellimicrobium mesophilum DSM 19309]